MNNTIFTIKLFLYFLLFAVSQTSFAEHSGDHLYQQHCSACHGSSGDGGVGVPLSLADFQSSVSDEYIRKSIRYGRPGRVMPAFSELTKSDVRAIITTIRQFTKATIPKEITTPIKGNSHSGRKLYTTHCATCHGAYGEGSKGTGVSFSRPRGLSVMSPALNNSGFLASATDHMIKQAIIKGRRGTPMISFKKHGLSDTNINDIVSFIRSFEKDITESSKKTELSPIISYDSPYSVNETVASIQRSAIGRNFRIIRIQTLNNNFVSEGNNNAKQVIVYFCNFGFLNKSLAIDPRIGMFLPCRVTVVEQNGKVKVMAINPLRLSSLFNNSELDRSCREMRDLYMEIIEEAIL